MRRSKKRWRVAWEDEGIKTELTKEWKKIAAKTEFANDIREQKTQKERG